MRTRAPESFHIVVIIMVLLGGTLEDAKGIGLGAMCVSGQYMNGVPLDEEAAFRFFKGVYDAGCRHFDTAEVYKSGPFNEPAGPDTVFNETQLGKFLPTVPRDSFTIATKYMPMLRADKQNPQGKCDYESVKGALLTSLKRLNLSYVDLYYSHVVLTREAGVEFVTSVKRLKEEGLVKNIGLSEIVAPWLRDCHAIHPICAIQQEWSLLTRDIEESLVPTCRELNVGIVAYSPLARNILTGPKTERPTDKRRENIPRFSAENWDKNNKVGEQVAALAAKKGVSPATLSMAWLLQKAKDLKVSVLPIPGTAVLDHAKDNMAGASVGALSPEEMALLEEIAKQAAGNRESDQYMSIRIEGQARKEVGAGASKL